MLRIRNAAVLAFLLCLAALPLSAATAGDFTFTFTGVQYNADGTSTWNYSLLWDKTASNSPALSHLTIELCQTARVVGYSPAGAEVGTDGSTGLYGIKWDMAIPEDEPTPFSFTLDRWYAEDPAGVRFSAKAGTLQNIAFVPGPSLACAVVAPAVALTKSCTPAVFVGDAIEYEITVTNTGNVELSNLVVTDALLAMSEAIGSLAVGESHVIRESVVASAAGTFPNSASVAGSWRGMIAVAASDGCETSVYELTVSKNAETSFERDHDWTVTKTADLSETEICSGSTATLGFTVDAVRETIDSGFQVSGTIVVSNPAPISAFVTVSDELEGVGNVVVDCGMALPAEVPAGGSITCTYAAALPNGSGRLNTARATLGNGHSFVGTANVLFGAPASETDASIEVTDLVSCPEGFLCSEVAPLVFGDSGSSQLTVDVSNASAMCNSYFTLENTVSFEDDGVAREAKAAVEIYTCSCNVGCTLTIGYWKTHAGFNGRNADEISKYLPLSLGTMGGGKSVQVVTPEQAVSLLSFSGDASNGINKLYAQLLAAKLNVANGASDAAALATIAEADAFLGQNDAAAWKALSKAVRAQVLTWMTLLDAYNNGDLGPGHCN